MNMPQRKGPSGPVNDELGSDDCPCILFSAMDLDTDATSYFFPIAGVGVDTDEAVIYGNSYLLPDARTFSRLTVGLSFSSAGSGSLEPVFRLVKMQYDDWKDQIDTFETVGGPFNVSVATNDLRTFEVDPPAEFAAGEVLLLQVVTGVAEGEFLNPDDPHWNIVLD